MPGEHDHLREMAQQQIDEQLLLWHDIFDSLPYPLYLIDAETGTTLLANKKGRASGRTPYCQVFSRPQQPDEKTKKQPASPIAEVKQTRNPLIIEHVEYSPSGTASMYDIHLFPVIDANGQIKKVIECDVDVTAQSRIRQALQESEARLRQVVESLPVVLASQDPAGRSTLLIGAVKELLGYEAQQFMDNPSLLASIVHPDDSVVAQELMKRCLVENRSVEIDFRIEHGTEHRTVWVHCKAVPILDEEGNLVRIDSILIDKTAEQHVADQREQLDARLHQMQRLESLGVMAGGIAHDFNNLLTVIGGNAQFLRESADLDAVQSKALADVETATRTSGEMVRTLQAFSRPAKPQIATLDVNILTQDLFRFLRRLIPLRIEFDFHPHNVPCHISADPGQIQQVLTNLCLNARDAIAEQGRLELCIGIVKTAELPPAARSQADCPAYIEISVSDTGQGMDEETISRAFDPFFTTKTKDQGTGLGLAIVYRIVQAHGGMIDVSSQPEKGSRFRIFLPQAEPPCTKDPASSPRAHGTEHVLVIDDEPMIASLIRTILETNGYRVAIAAHPDHAISMSQDAHTRIDLAIIDYDLPGMDGLACLTALRQHWPRLKCIMISGHNINAAEIEALGGRLLAKPFSSQAIAETVREMLDKTHNKVH